MSSKDFIDKTKQYFADFMLPDKERIEKLRLILESEQKRKITHKEAEEVGIELMGLYECLAGHRKIIRRPEDSE